MRQPGRLRQCVVLAVLVLLAACARPSYPSISASATANPQKAYLYGRFWLDRPFGHAGRLAFELEQANGRQLLRLRLRDQDPVYAIEIDSGTYRIKDVLQDSPGMFDWETVKASLAQLRLPEYLATPITAEAGKAYYLGDFDGRMGYAGLFHTAPFAIQFSTNFDKTSELAKNAVPALKSLELVRAWKEIP